jgi:hypothetical protein
MPDITDEDRRHFELIGYLRQLIGEIHGMSREFHDFMEIQRHPMFNYSAIGGAASPYATAQNHISEESANIARGQWDSLASIDLIPRQVYPQETVTGWDPADNHV